MSIPTHQIRPDYLNAASPLRPFYQYPLPELDFGQIMRDKGRDQPDRATLSAVLRDQYRGLEMGPQVEAQMRRLEQEEAFTVTTGHQLVLFGGPLFTIYKVMSTIRLAEQLTQEQGHPVVPIFWIHTEDHDFEEINHYYDGFGEKRTYPGSFDSKVGLHQLEDSIRDLWSQRLPEALNQAYLPGKSLAQATREFFHALFKDYGLLILDADDARLKRQFVPVMQQEVQQQMTQQLVEETSAQLVKTGYSAQINPREINLFYADEQGRDRLILHGDQFAVRGRDEKYTQSDLLDLIDAHPERFSPNVSLRPLYQEMILPNLAYFGGWGELSYWLQLKGVFDHFGVNYPAVLPRFSATVLPADWRQEWEGLGFKGMDVRRPLHELYRDYMPRVWNSAPFDALEEKILAQVAELRDYIEAEVSPTLARSADALRTKNLNFLHNLRKKTHRVTRHRHPEPFRQIEELKLQVNPDGQVQERVWSLVTVAQWKSPENFMTQVYQQCSPLNFAHQALEL